MHHRKPLGLSLLVAAATLYLPRPAGAEDPARLLRKANEQCAGTEPAAALPIYEEALAARSLPQIHLAYGDCLRQLGKYDQAIEQYERYLQLAKSRKNREQAEALIKLCKEEREGAAAAVPPPTATVPAEQASAGEQPPDLKAAKPAAPPPVPTRRRLRPLYFWTGVGVTAALVAAGVACGAVAWQKSNRFKDLSTPYEELQGLKDSGEALKLASIVSFSVAGATAVATTVLFFFTRFKAADTVSAAPLPGGAVVVLGGRF